MDIDLLRSTVWFGLAGVLLYLPLLWLLPAQTFRNSRRAVVMGASLFWLGFTTVLVNLAWGYYYRFFYPAWMRWGTALIACALYSAYAFACHWFSGRLRGHPMLWFCLFTGLLAANEHYIAWNFARLPEKVPILEGMPLVPTMLFAFFEYQVYWASALWLAWILIKLSDLRKHPHDNHPHPWRLRRNRPAADKTFARADQFSDHCRGA
jgi:hypothetical protein